MTEDNIYDAIKAVLIELTDVPGDNIFTVYQSRHNGVLPSDDYIIMTFAGDIRLGTPSARCSENTYTVNQAKQGSVQIDFFGEKAKQWADAAVDGSCSAILYDMLEPYGIQPLYCDETRNATVDDGEQQYVRHWTVQLEITYNTSLNVSADTFSKVQLNNFKTEL